MSVNNIADNLKGVRLEDKDVEKFSLDKTLKFIIEGSERLKCSITTRTKALLIYHQFKRCVHEVKYDDYLVAAACISLSIKFNEEDVEFDAIILAFYNIVNRPLTSTKDKKLKTIRTSLTQMEIIILRMIEFYLNHRLAHEYLVHYLNDIFEHVKVHVWDVLTETCMKIATDFYLSNKCLLYKPDEIAIATLSTALHIVGINVNDDSYLKIWFQALNKASIFDTTISDITMDIFRICDVGPVAESQKVIDKNIKNLEKF